jgi:hypothetical protein
VHVATAKTKGDATWPPCELLYSGQRENRHPRSDAARTWTWRSRRPVTLTTICGTDIHLEGEYPCARLTVGHEPVGVIEAIGLGVTAIRPAIA